MGSLHGFGEQAGPIARAISARSVCGHFRDEGVVHPAQVPTLGAYLRASRELGMSWTMMRAGPPRAGEDQQGGDQVTSWRLWVPAGRSPARQDSLERSECARADADFQAMQLNSGTAMQP